MFRAAALGAAHRGGQAVTLPETANRVDAGASAKFTLWTSKRMPEAQQQCCLGAIIFNMSIEVEWRISDEEPGQSAELSPPISKKPRRRLPRWWWAAFVLLVVVIAAAAGVYLRWTYRTQLAQVAEPVREVARLEAQAVIAGDQVWYMALQDPNDAAWRMLQEKRFARLERLGLPEFGWEAMGIPPQFGDVVLEPGGARLDVTYFLSVTHPLPAGPVTVTLRVPQFYRQTPSGWVRAMPGADFWGRWRIKSGTRFAIGYLARDGQVLEPLIPRMDAMLARICDPLPCPRQPIYVSFENSADVMARLGDFSLGFEYSNFLLRFPSPHLFGLPADASSREELYRVIGTRVVQALVYEATDRRLDMNYLSSGELVRWELAQAGLTGPFITPSATAALTSTLRRRGTWLPLSSIAWRVSVSEADTVQAAMLPLAFDFLEQYMGPGTVTRLLPAVASDQVRTLGDAINLTLHVNSRTLESAWQVYLRQRIGLPAVEPALPGGVPVLEWTQPDMRPEGMLQAESFRVISKVYTDGLRMLFAETPERP